MLKIWIVSAVRHIIWQITLECQDRHFISTQRLEDAQVMSLVCHTRPYHHTFTTLFSRWFEVFCANMLCIVFFKLCIMLKHICFSCLFPTNCSDYEQIENPTVSLLLCWSNKLHVIMQCWFPKQFLRDGDFLIFNFFFHSGCSCLWIIPCPKPAATISLPASLSHLRKNWKHQFKAVVY